ncbi:MAG: peroxiredoxin family protein [Burkholderiales bacterium]
MAPDFSGYDMLNRPIRLCDYRGHWLMLSFYRYASCPLCNLRVHDLSRRYMAWQSQGLQMLAVFQSPPDKLRQYTGRQETPFPLMPDPEQRLYTKYRVKNSWAGFLKAWLTRLPEIGRSVFGHRFFPGSVEGGIHRIPADFIINPEGRIVIAYYGRDIGDHLPVNQIDRLLQQALHNDMEG